MTTVRDVMRETTPTARPDTPFKELVTIMDMFRTSAVPVVDAGGRFAGMVTEADVLLKEVIGPNPEPGRFERWRRHVEIEKAAGTTAADLMTADVPRVGPDAPVWEAAQEMYDHGVIRLPVVDDRGVMLGVVTWRDLLQVFLRTDDAIRAEIVDRLLRRDLMGDPETLHVYVENGVVNLTGMVREHAIPLVLDLIRDVEGVVEIKHALIHKRVNTASR